ncbi:MAG: ATP-binding protein [Ilumatobacter sp.]|nr:ATP-binding protein [Ilumatobacter sp.]
MEDLEPTAVASPRQDVAGRLARYGVVPAARSSDRVLTGAAAGWAQRCGVEPAVFRAALGLLGLVGGLGVVLYGALVVASEPTSSSTPRPTPPNRRRDVAIGCITALVLIAAREIGVWPSDGIMIAASAVALGIGLAWAQPDSRVVAWSRRQRIRQLLQLVAGLGLLGAGVISLASRTGGLGNVGASAAAIAVFVGGLAMFGAPALGRLLRSLDEERSMRIREDELARVSAHLHDSVLQSLVLIQRSEDPRRMSSLARRQERELRAWLYGITPAGDPNSVHEAVAALTSEIEADHDLRVEAVVVGDQPLDDAARSLVAALREAIVNAARHAGVDRIDVFVEADDAELTGFVRDTGVGFDTSANRESANGHRGIADSIVKRIERAGGTAVIESRPGVGTEVELRVPRVRA